ncbi:hypothetical protein ABWH88_04240 [Marinobacter adhaerens]|uniref:hypothetical protein n=1 Tax=Marinobacter adhaerens TaxID=1033846 RepID=UPI0035D0F38F
MGELDKYVIRYGQDADELSEEVVVTNAQAEAEMSYEVSGSGRRDLVFHHPGSGYQRADQ